jgi:hypothetical protein
LPLLTRLLDSPFLGFAPWIALSVLEGPGRLELAAGVALAMSVAFVVLDKARGRSLKMLGVIDVICFATLLIVGLMLSNAHRHWLETWFGEISNIILVAVVVGSMICRVPFTIQYAKEETPQEYWNSPTFLRINYMITGAWAVAFIVSAIAGWYGDAVLHNSNNIWTGWVIQIGADVVAVQFTNWYPDRATAIALRSAGQPTPPPAPIADLLVPLAGYLTPVGIVALSFGAGPTWLGIGLIVAGVVLTQWLRKASAAETAVTAAHAPQSL